MCVVLRYCASRDDYEVVDKSGRCRGFVWRQADRWACRVDDRAAQYCDTLDEAKVLAVQMADERVSL